MTDITVLKRKQNVSGRALVLLVLVVAVVSSMLSIQFLRGAGAESRRSDCLSRRAEVAAAELAYFKKHHRWLTGGEKELYGLDDLPEPALQLHCSQGFGKYSAALDANGRLVLHCSVGEHDRNPDGTTGLLMNPPEGSNPQPK